MPLVCLPSYTLFTGKKNWAVYKNYTAVLGGCTGIPMNG
jgi:hypothetical protein